MPRGGVIDGSIFVYDRQGRSDVVDAFRMAGWKPMKRGGETGYYYLSRSESDGGTPRYVTYGTKAEVDRLAKALDQVLREGGGGFDPYIYG